jgi:hypothetical protein
MAYPPPTNAMARFAANAKLTSAPSPQSDNLPRPPSSSPAASPAMGPLPVGMPQPRGGRVDPALMASLPPEFAAMLEEYGQLMDIDGDGTPDVAVVPLPGGNAMAAAAAIKNIPVAAPTPTAPGMNSWRFPNEST